MITSIPNPKTMYLLFIVQEEGAYAQKFSSLKEAKSSFKEAKNEDNIAVALYDLEKDSHFGLSNYGEVDGEPIQSWHNEDF